MDSDEPYSQVRARRAAQRAAGKGPALRRDLPIHDIAAAYHAGDSLPTLARRYGVTQRTIEIRLEIAGVPLRPNAEATRLAHRPGKRQRHGRTGWRAGCRCDECRSDHNAEAREHRLRRPEAQPVVEPVVEVKTRVPQSVSAAVDALARARGVSRSELLRQVIADGVRAGVLTGPQMAGQVNLGGAVDKPTAVL